MAEDWGYHSHNGKWERVLHATGLFTYIGARDLAIVNK